MNKFVVFDLFFRDLSGTVLYSYFRSPQINPHLLCSKMKCGDIQKVQMLSRGKGVPKKMYRNVEGGGGLFKECNFHKVSTCKAS